MAYISRFESVVPTLAMEIVRCLTFLIPCVSLGAVIMVLYWNESTVNSSGAETTDQLPTVVL